MSKMMAQNWKEFQAEFVAVIVAIEERYDQLKEKFKNFWNDIKDGWMKGIEEIKESIKNLPSNIIKPEFSPSLAPFGEKVPRIGEAETINKEEVRPVGLSQALKNEISRSINQRASVEIKIANLPRGSEVNESSDGDLKMLVHKGYAFGIV
jgi:archaellum component FlaC